MRRGGERKEWGGGGARGEGEADGISTSSITGALDPREGASEEREEREGASEEREEREGGVRGDGGSDGRGRAGAKKGPAPKDWPLISTSSITGVTVDHRGDRRSPG